MQKNFHQMKQLSPFEAAWLAGFVDGEGYIGIVRHPPLKHSHKPSTMDWYSCRFSITNTDRPILEQVKEMVGYGTVSTTSKHLAWKPMTIYGLNGKDKIRNILIQILPFLRLKKRQAELVISFVELRAKDPNHAGHGQTSYTSEEIAIYRTLRELNRKGRKVSAEEMQSE